MITITTNAGKYFFTSFAKLSSEQTISIDEKDLLHLELLCVYKSIISKRLVVTAEDADKIRKELLRRDLKQ